MAPMSNINCMNFMSWRYASQRGAVVPIMALLVTALVGFLGVSLYMGLTTFLQNEAQNVVSTAAMAGAAAYYDGASTGIPVLSGAKAQQSATAVRDRMYNQSPALKSLQFTPTSLAVDDIKQTVLVGGKLSFNTPFLEVVKIKKIEFTAEAAARYAHQHYTNPISIETNFTPGSDRYQHLRLIQPLIDGNGPDLYIQAGRINGSRLHGYMVEACAGTDCVDIGRAAVLSGSGLFMDRVINGVTRRVIYGDVYIDLDALGPYGYNRLLNKASLLKIIDDGVNDQMEAGVRYLELVPQPTTIERIDIYHHAVACQIQNGTPNCATPAPGFQWGTTP